MNLKEKNFREIYRAWKSNLGNFEPFMRSGPFVSLQTYSDFEITYSLDEQYIYREHKDKLMDITSHDLEKTFIIIDINMRESLEMAYLINNKFNIKPIINFNFLFHPYGLIGNKDSIERLIILGENLKIIKPKAYVLFLDYERYGEFEDDEYKKKLNNQYEFLSEDLPYGKVLKSIGYTKLIVYTKADVKGDMKAYVSETNNDLNIEIKSWG
ncbi:MAG: normocyte-binding protein [Clostridium sp.]|uniref:normocyte-binding protein n=1 Tax=Clostridium sp. TaxID=1506 RepID=UPI003066AB49